MHAPPARNNTGRPLARPAFPSLVSCRHGNLNLTPRQNVVSLPDGAVACHSPAHPRFCARQSVLLRRRQARRVHHRPVQQRWKLRLVLSSGRPLSVRQRVLESAVQCDISLWLYRSLLYGLHLPVQVWPHVWSVRRQLCKDEGDAD